MELNPIALDFIPNETGTTPDNQGIDIAGHAAADIGRFEIPFKCEVVAALVEVKEGLAGSTGTAEVKFDKRFTAGSDTGRSDGTVGDINLGVTGVSAAGDVAYDVAGVGVSLEPGEEVIVQLISGTSGTGETGHIWPKLWVRQLPETKANLSALQETA